MCRLVSTWCYSCRRRCRRRRRYCSRSSCLHQSDYVVCDSALARYRGCLQLLQLSALRLALLCAVLHATRAVRSAQRVAVANLVAKLWVFV
jgi:hypothetical protein